MYINTYAHLPYLSKLLEMDLSVKDPIFTTQETYSFFMLISHLKEYGKRDIKIEINEDGSRITVSCEQTEKMSGFHKTFKIPEGVVLDKVKARFDQDESRLTIRMPKSVKGLTGLEDASKGQEEDVIMSNGTKHDQEYEERDVTHEAEPPQRKVSTPTLARSALFVSLIVIAFNFFRSRHESNQRRH